MSNDKLIRAIQRSERAYSLYRSDKKYFQALRIFQANVQLYSLLEVYQFECSSSSLPEVHDFLFHLEDWFAQFKLHESQHEPDLNDKFVFNRLEGSPPYPKNFIQTLKTKGK